MALVCTIDGSGIAAPDYADVLDAMRGDMRAVFGPDIYLDPDSQDGQMLAIYALAQHDTNSMAVAVYNAFSPATAQGEGLSRVVKINGIARAAASYSSVDLVLTGTVGTVIEQGIARDEAGNSWFLDATVVIPASGQATMTATYQDKGAFQAAPGTIATIGSPTRGWQTVGNPGPATPGAPVESDAALRLRQARSTMLPSRSVLDGVRGAVASLPGVTRVAAYENDTDVTDARGIPSHTLALVVDGGDAQAIANAIGAKKGPGAGTYGTTAQTVVDVYAIPRPIRFFRPILVRITVSITVQALPGYSTPVGAAIRQAVAAYITALPIAEAVRLSRLYVPIDGIATTFNVTALRINRPGGTAAAADVVLAFNETAVCDLADVTVLIGS